MFTFLASSEVDDDKVLNDIDFWLRFFLACVRLQLKDAMSFDLAWPLFMRSSLIHVSVPSSPTLYKSTRILLLPLLQEKYQGCYGYAFLWRTQELDEKWSNLTLKWVHLLMILRLATSQDLLADLQLAELHQANTQTCTLSPKSNLKPVPQVISSC